MPDCADLKQRVLQLERLLTHRLNSKFALAEAQFEFIKNRASFDKSERFFEKKEQEIDSLYDRMFNSVNQKLQNSTHKTEKIILKIDACSPLKIMSRGFASVTKDGKTVKSVLESNVGDSINVRFADGDVDCTVNRINKQK